MLEQGGRHHGRSLLPAPEDVAGLRERSRVLVAIDLDTDQLALLELLLSGALRPLSGYLDERDSRSVRAHARLASGAFWPITANLHVPAALRSSLEVGSQASLRHPEGMVLAILTVADVVPCDCADANPSVHVGGRLDGLELPPRPSLDLLSIRQPRVEEASGSRPLLGYQTRRTLHRADIEFLADEMERLNADLLLQVLVSHDQQAWNDDVRRAHCCRLALDHLPPGCAAMTMVPDLRIADPALDAVAAGIILCNSGCTHAVVDTPALQASNPREAMREIGIEPVDYARGRRAGEPIDDGELREFLVSDREIPAEFTYPEVLAEIKRWFRPRRERGFTVFFTGLSGAGKSTIASVLMARLLSVDERPVTLLDGDIVRSLLSSGLGFSRADRDLNIARIAYVAAEVTRNGGIAICAPIAPYRRARDEARRSISRYGGFVEVHVSTSLEVAEQRDRKGLYAKARRGQLKGLTGIDDPYEAPEHPEIVIDGAQGSPEEAAALIIGDLESRGYLELHGRRPAASM